MPRSVPILLLLRDLRLHWAALLLPAGIALLASFGAHKTGENPMVLLGLSAWIALLIPHALHLREEHQGTLGDLRALPATPAHIVTLRLLEALMAVLIVTALHFVMSLALRGPAALTGLQVWISPGWLWLILLCLCLPLPITLCWGGKGWITMFVGTFALGSAWALVASRFGNEAFWRSWFNRLFAGITYLEKHPGQHALGLLLLCLACLPLAAAGYRRRDA